MNVYEHLKILKEATKDLEELEKVRYVYLYIGNVVSFDINYNFECTVRKKIYKNIFYDNITFNGLLESGFGICKSIAYLFKFILENLGTEAHVIVLDEYEKNCPHVYNFIRLKDGRGLYFDLQNDLVSIKSRLRTKHFGKDGKDNLVISYQELEKIDRTLGYISSDNYYLDEYFYLLKSVTYYMSFEERFQFLMENLDAYHLAQNMNYVEFTKFFVNGLGIFFNRYEMQKINMYHMYETEGDLREYSLCFILTLGNSRNKIYLYSKEEGRFVSISAYEFYNRQFKVIGKMPKLKRVREDN